MKYAYVVIEDEINFTCVCEDEADAQEMILSLTQNMDYDNYIYWLEYDKYARPEQFFFSDLDNDESAYYKKVIAV